MMHSTINGPDRPDYYRCCNTIARALVTAFLVAVVGDVNPDQQSYYGGVNCNDLE